MIQSELQKSSVPIIRNDLGRGKSDYEKMGYSVIENSAQKSHDHSKPHSTAVKEVILGNGRDVVIGRTIDLSLNRRDSQELENNAAMLHKPPRKVPVRPDSWYKKYFETRFPDLFPRLTPRLDVVDHRKTIHKGSQNNSSVVLEPLKLSPLAVDGPTSHRKTNRTKKKRCKRRRCRKHSSHQHSSVSEGCMMWSCLA